MYNADKIIPALIIFFLLITLPFWYSWASGKAAYAPEPEIITQEKQCLETKQWMREKHMDLLTEWKESAVRQGKRTYVARDGREYEISLTATCLRCHSNKAEFCDRCHDYVGTKPDCWHCHTPPEAPAR